MTCDDVRAKVIDALAMPRATLDADVRAHLDSCAACRAARDDYTTMWRELSELAVPEAPADARARFDRQLADVRRRSVTGGAPRAPWSSGAWAATVLIALLAGYRLGIQHASGRAPLAQSTPVGGDSTYLILLHTAPDVRHDSTPAAAAATYADYVRWAQQLPSGVTLVSTASLPDSAVWFGPSGEAADHGDRLDGFLMIHAKNRAAAMQVAATCPRIKDGGRVELRMVANFH